MITDKKIDKPFLFLSLILLCCGILIFYSAALGFASRDHIEYSSLLFSQLVIGLIFGLLCSIIIFSIKYTFFKKIAPYFFIASFILLLLVFIPGIGYESNGATRWIIIAGISLQPTEFLKFAIILFFSAWIAKFQKRNTKTCFGIFSFLILLALTAIPLLLQPDFDAVVLLAIPLIIILIVSKAPLKQLFIWGIISVTIVTTAGMLHDHVRTRAISFFNQSADGSGANYQIQQAMLAIGSGELTGKGYGRSAQKFAYLPEPVGDSIFAIFSEEMGFIGATFLIFIYALWALRGYRIAIHSTDNFSKYFITGSVTLIIMQSFLNIGSMTGIIPIVGMPLVFVSHGGTALLINLCIVALILNMSRYQKQNVY